MQKKRRKLRIPGENRREPKNKQERRNKTEKTEGCKGKVFEVTNCFPTAPK
jgi:hypothetical protein